VGELGGGVGLFTSVYALLLPAPFMHGELHCSPAAAAVVVVVLLSMWLVPTAAAGAGNFRRRGGCGGQGGPSGAGALH
jgi:hypothetical protein